MKLLADLETDNLLTDVTTIWCACFEDFDTGETWDFTPDNMGELPSFLYQQPITELIFHNGIGYDLPVLNKITNIEYSVSPDTFCRKEILHTDTLLISKLLNPDREGGHSLEAWGKRLRCFKGSYDDWSQYTTEMLLYCKQDVAVLKKIYIALMKEMNQ